MVHPIQRFGVLPQTTTGVHAPDRNCNCSYCSSMNFTAPATTKIATNTNNQNNSSAGVFAPPTISQIQNYPTLQQIVVPQLLSLFGGKFKKLSDITLENLPPALPTTPEQIRLLSSDDPLLDEMIPNIKKLREMEVNSGGKYKLIAFENIANHDVIAILDEIGTNSVMKAIQIAENSPLYDQRTNILYPHNGVSREITGVKMHELAHWLTLHEVKPSYAPAPDIQLSDYKQGISFILTRDQSGSSLVTGLRSFGQTTYRHQKIFERHDGLVNEFNSLEGTFQQIAKNGYQVYDAQNQTWRRASKADLAELVNRASSLVNRGKDLMSEEETLEMAAYAPQILVGTIFEEHGNPSKADKDKYKIAKELQAETINLIREAQILLNKIEAVQSQVTI